MGLCGRTYMPVSSRYRKYNYSAKGQARRKLYETGHPDRFARTLEYERERRHGIQERAGCHLETSTFYPGYRLLQSLGEAEVIEI